MSPDSRKHPSSPGIGAPSAAGEEADEDLLFVEEAGKPRFEAPAQAKAPAGRSDSQTPAKPASASPGLSRSSIACAPTVLAPNRAPRGFVFVPTWDAFHKILSTYSCTPVAPLGPRQAIFGHQILPKGASDLERAEFDKRTFDQVLATVTRLQRERAAALVGFSIDYASLSNGRARDLMTAAFRSLPKSLSNLITVEISNTPDHIPTTTLGERIALVKPYFRAVSFQLPALSHQASRFSYMGLHALVYRLWDWAHDDRPLDFVEIAGVIKHAKSEHLQFGFAGVPDIALAHQLAEAGATYLSGPFLGAAIDFPLGMRRCTLEQIALERRAAPGRLAR